MRAVFYGLGADGTVGANKNSIKIIGEETAVLRPGLLRLRLEEVRGHHRLAPALRAEPHPLRVPGEERRLRGLPPVRVRGDDRRPGPGGAGGHVPPELALWPGRGVGSPPARGAGGHRGEEAPLLRDRRLQGGPRRGHGRPHQHGDAGLLLRPVRRAAAGRGHRPDQGGDREDLRQARRGGGEAELRRGGRDPRPSPRGAATRPPSGRPAGGRPSWPRRRPTSCSGSPR